MMLPYRAPPGSRWSRTCPSVPSHSCSCRLAGCVGPSAASSSTSAAQGFYHRGRSNFTHWLKRAWRKKGSGSVWVTRWKQNTVGPSSLRSHQMWSSDHFSPGWRPTERGRCLGWELHQPMRWGMEGTAAAAQLQNRHKQELFDLMFWFKLSNGLSEGMPSNHKTNSIIQLNAHSDIRYTFICG